jgi:hypothetical protein
MNNLILIFFSVGVDEGNKRLLAIGNQLLFALALREM